MRSALAVVRTVSQSGTGMAEMGMSGMAMMAPMAWTPGYALVMFFMWWIMMLAMMLPISVGGWGLREVAALSMLSALGRTLALRVRPDRVGYARYAALDDAPPRSIVTYGGRTPSCQR